MVADITIIMPSLNVVNYISECLDSVVRQLFPNLEILCIDAGSTDGTQEIIESYTQKDARIRLIHSDKKSYGYQVNLGISMAQGRYIGIVETDDFIRRDMYQVLYDAIDGTDFDFVKADYDSFFELDGDYVFGRACTFFEEKDKYNCALNSQQLAKVYGSDNTLWKGLYRKSFLDNAHIRLHESSGAAYQDVGFLIQVLSRAKKGMYLDDSLYCYRQGRAGASMVSKNCFSYIKNEIEWILGKDILKQVAQEHRIAGMERIVGVFLEQYGNALCRYDFNWRDDMLTELHEWFTVHMDDYLAQYHVDLTKVNLQLWDNYRMALDNPKQYAQNCRDKYEAAKGELEELKKQGEFVIFGAGARGYEMLRKCVGYGAFPSAIIDNNTALWGKSWGEIPIVSPRECIQRHQDAAYVIANKKNQEAIRQQLMENGMKESQIIIYRQ